MQQFPILIESFRHSHCDVLAPDDSVFDDGGVVVVADKEHAIVSEATTTKKKLSHRWLPCNDFLPHHQR